MNFHEYTDEMVIDEFKAFHNGKEPDEAVKNCLFQTRDMRRIAYNAGLKDGQKAASSQKGKVVA